MAARPQGEADIPLDALKRTSFPKLVLHAATIRFSRRFAMSSSANLKAERATIRAAGHNVQFTDAPFNERLEAFLKGVSRGS